jgi:RNA polymerase sigma-70 factor (ECF subfamily)
MGNDKAMATCEPGAPTLSDVVACTKHLRAFAIMLAGDRRRADDLVHDTIKQTLTAVNWPPTGVDLKVQMFAVLHRLHYAALRPSTERSARQRESPPSREGGLESDALLRIFGRLRDEQREALILTIASGLSYQQAAEVCGCQIAMIKSRVSEAWREISQALQEPSPGRKTNFASLGDKGASESSADSTCAAQGDFRVLGYGYASSIFPMGSDHVAGGYHELAPNRSELEAAQRQSRLSLGTLAP